jgi:predicted secreted protein
LIHGVVLGSAFAIIWFLALFCVLPIGLGREEGDARKPPPNLLAKVGIATAIAVVVWLGFYGLVLMGVFDI